MDRRSFVVSNRGVAVSNTLETLSARVAAEYREMPGLSLTAEQAARLMGVQLWTCQTILRELVRVGILYNTSTGGYAATPPVRDKRRLYE